MILRVMLRLVAGCVSGLILGSILYVLGAPPQTWAAATISFLVLTLPAWLPE